MRINPYEEWSEAKKECFEDFMAEIDKRRQVLRKSKKKAKPSENYREYEFDEVRKLYPRTTSRPMALKAWNKLKPNEALIELMRSHMVEAYKETEKQYIPHFATYLNQAKYEEEIVIKPVEFLKLPTENEELLGFAGKNGLPKPDYAQDFYGYRAKLTKFIKENNILQVKK